MNRSGLVSFTREQVEYLMEKTGREEPYEAIDAFTVILREMGVSPEKIMLYLDKLMDRDSGRLK